MIKKTEFDRFMSKIDYIGSILTGEGDFDGYSNPVLLLAKTIVNSKNY